MFQHVTFDRGRRALLGVAGALILQGVLQPTTASGQTSSSPKMKIGIIGAGHIGGTIGEFWVKADHPVFFSSRHPEELKDFVAGLVLLPRPARSIRRLRLVMLLHSCALWRSPEDRPGLTENYLRARLCSTPTMRSSSRDGAVADEAERDGIGVTSQNSPERPAGARV